MDIIVLTELDIAFGIVTVTPYSIAGRVIAAGALARQGSRMKMLSPRQDANSTETLRP